MPWSDEDQPSGGAVDPAIGHDIAGVGFVPSAAGLTPFRDALGNAVTQLGTLPQRALEASETMRQGGDYDPAPAMETAGLMAGARFPFAKAGELGTFGGKLYSAASDAVNAAKFEKAYPNQWLGYLRNTPGVKPEELNWLGTPEFLQSQRGPVTKEQLAAHVREHQLELRDATKSGSGSDPDNFDSPRYANYQLPGGENYREMLITMPEKAGERGPKGWGDTAGGTADTANFRSSHWDEPNVLAHVRFNDRTIGGKKTLFVEEIQSDWHQAGRRQGYARGDELPEGYELKEYPWANHWSVFGPNGAIVAQGGDRSTAIANARGLTGSGLGVPDAPFKTSWPELAMKRILKFAADHDYEQVAWTPGHTQAARYDLSKQIKSVRFEKSGTSGFTRPEHIDDLSDYGRLTATDHQGRKVIERSVNQNELPNFIGKDVAEKLLQADPKYSTTGGTAHNIRELSGLDLSVGGEGMNKFYDEILPATANKIVKKYGARVRQIEGADQRTFAHVLPITDALKRMAKERGFPLFKRGGRVGQSRQAHFPPARPFVIPLDALKKLGGGDGACGIAILWNMLDVHPFAGPPGYIPAETVEAIGGRRVLEKFVQRIRRGRIATSAGRSMRPVLSITIDRD